MYILWPWLLVSVGHALLFIGVLGIVISVLSKESDVLHASGWRTVFGVVLLNFSTVWMFNPLPVLLWTLAALVINMMFPKAVIGPDGDPL